MELPRWLNGERPRAWLAGWVLVAFPLAVFAYARVVHQFTFTYDDFDYYFYPWKASLYQTFGQHGLFPLWNPWEFSGLPFLADVQTQMLYPLNWIFFFWPTPGAIVFFTMAHLALASIFTYRWLRMLDTSRAAALVGGLSFGLSSFLVLHASQTSVLTGCCWLPAGMLTIERLLRRSDRREVLLAGLYIAQALLAGSPQILFISLWGWFPYLIWRSWGTGPAVWKRLGASVALALLLILPQILASGELFHHAMRGAARNIEFATKMSYDPGRWWTFLVPYAEGNPAVKPDPTYTFHEYTPFVGCVPLFLALFAVSRRRGHPQQPLCVCMLVVGTLLALGYHTPVLLMFIKLVPGFDWFRVPARWLLLTTCWLAPLAAFGLDRMRVVGESQLWEWGKATGIAWSALATVIALGLMTGQLDYAREAAMTVLGFWAAASVLVWMSGPIRTMGAALLVVLTLAELSWFGGSYLRYTADVHLYDRMPLLPGMPTVASAGRGMTQTANNQQFLYGEWAQGVHVRNIQGSNPLMLGDTMDYLMTATTGRPPDEKQQLGLLDHDGFFTQNAETHNPMLLMLDMRWQITRGGDHDVMVAIPGGFGPGWAVGSTAVMARTEELAMLWLRRADPHGVLLLESPFPVSHPERPGAIAANIVFTSYTPDRIEYDIDMPSDGYVVTSEVFYPGWKCTVDGQDTPMVRADALLRAFWVPSGHHHAVVQLLPWWLFSIPLSGLVLLATLGTWMWLGLRTAMPAES